MSVCCILKTALPPCLIHGVHIDHHALESFVTLEMCLWFERAIAERDVRYMQIIPYVVMTDPDGRLVCYQRHGAEKRLVGLWSCGIGGHLESSDKGITLHETIMNGLKREIEEELKGFSPNLSAFAYRGIITEDSSPVGLCHLGCVYHYTLSSKELPLIPGDELSDMHMESPVSFLRNKHEYWSELAIKTVQEGCDEE